jgi:hypothetical protein
MFALPVELELYLVAAWDISTRPHDPRQLRR